MNNSTGIKGLRLFLLIMLASLRAAVAAPGCFIKDGDRVGFFGDSITAHKVYGDLVERVFRHAHPGARVEFVNNGQAGLQLAATRIEKVVKGDPTVVTIMIGMNDAINSRWVKGDPVAPKLAEYREDLTALVRGLKEQGRVVVVMSPTLTDETVAGSVFRLEGTVALLKGMGEVCQQVAETESVYFVPVQSEFEAYADSISRYALLRPDGVHPCARGHYQIARSLWTHLNLGGPLEGERGVVASPEEPPVTLDPLPPLLPADSNSLPLTLHTGSSDPLLVSWSLGPVSGTVEPTAIGTNTWTVSLPEQVFPRDADTSSSVILHIAQGAQSRFHVLDLFRRPVLHGRDGLAEASMTNETGTVVCTYRVEREGKALRIEASVFKPHLVHIPGSMWPWGSGDSLNLLMDLRDPATFGGLGYDGDVFQAWFNPQEIPLFSPGFIPWAGRHLTKLAKPYGARTPEGYTVGVLLSGNLNIKESVNYAKRPYIGLDLSLGYATSEKQKKTYGTQKPDRDSFLFPGTFTLVDLEGAIEEDTALTLSLFPGQE